MAVAVLCVCGESYPHYRTDDRHCKKCEDRYRQHKFFRDVSVLASSFATIMPEATISERLLNRGFADLLLGSSDGGRDPKDLLKKVFLSRLPLPCGQPILFEMKRLAQFAGFGGTWVLDLSPYI